MKIINEKGKLFGLINIVDLLVLIAAVAVAAGVGYKLFAPQIKESVQPQVELTAIVRVRGATPFLVTEVERNSQVGKQLVSGNSYVNGTIEDMKIEDYAQQVTTADGRIVTAVWRLNLERQFKKKRLPRNWWSVPAPLGKTPSLLIVTSTGSSNQIFSTSS